MRNYRFNLASAVVAALLLTACAGISFLDKQPVGGIADHREYKYLLLDNGMRVLLVSDRDADKAAAALDVNVGSRHDPDERQGLAHFLEHMLFLGTQKYPDAGEYERFINAHAGGHNAYTSFEHTNYFFDVAHEQLEPALDRFSRFFIDPLFNEKYVSREVNAVESEYRARIRDDRRRIYDVVKTEVNPAHPFRHFSVGSLQTLQAADEAALRNALLEFYGRWYSAHRMSLVVSGPRSLEELEALVRPRFSQVLRRDVPEDKITVPLFKAEDLPLRMHIQPLQNSREISYGFEIGDMKSLYRSKPAAYVGNLLGHEGEGSLLATLKAQGWAETLSAGTAFDFNGGGMLSVSITLTESGYAHRDDVTALVFAAIDLVRRKGVERWRFEELAVLGHQQFQYRNIPDAINDVSAIASQLHEYSAEHVLNGPYLYSKYSETAIRQLLADLVPGRVQIAVVAPEIKATKKSAYYSTPYSIERGINLPPASSLAKSLAAKLALPPPNIFIAHDLSLRTPAVDVRTPVQLKSDEGLDVWHRTDAGFGVPKGSINILLRAPSGETGLVYAARNLLWLNLVDDELNSWEYPANLAGLNVALRPDRRGVQITIRGYNEKQHKLLEQVLETLKAPAADSARFSRVKDELVRGLQNSRQVEPYRLLMKDLGTLLRKKDWLHEELLPAVERVDLAQVVAHAGIALDGTAALVQINGNYSGKEARRIAGLIQQKLPLADGIINPSDDVLQLPRGELVNIVASEHKDTSVLAYLQAASADKAHRVSVGVIAQMLSSDFYRVLRTEKQLGYVVSAYAYPQRDAAGLVLLVQSPVADSETVRAEIGEFLTQWQQSAIDEAAFDRHKAALLSRLLESPTNLWEASDRYWRDLLIGYTAFDGREQLVNALNALTYEQWRSHVKALFGADTRRVLWLLGSSNVDVRRLPGRLIADRIAFKRDARWFSFP